jgi:signal transduction histidine kinase
LFSTTNRLRYGVQCATPGEIRRSAKRKKIFNDLRDHPLMRDEASETVDRQEPEASSLIEHIQGVMEHQKALLARELHDELGGLLVGAVMDLAWAEQHLSAPAAELKQKLVRARQTLSAAIDLKRKLIEDLRPTLLDNVGLFAALRWHVQATCKHAGFNCTIRVPDDERRFFPNIPIALFRIVQEALAVVVARKPVTPAEFSVTLDEAYLAIEVRSEAPLAPEDAVKGTDTHFLAAIEQRVASLKGVFRAVGLPAGGTVITARFPLESVALPA